MTIHAFAQVNPLRDALSAWRYLSSMNGVSLKLPGDDLAVMCDGLMYEYVEALGALQAAETTLELVALALTACRAECDDLHDELDAWDAQAATSIPSLIQLIHWEHDHNHTSSWAACRHKTCRGARRRSR